MLSKQSIGLVFQGRRFDSHRVRHIFQACPVWIYTQTWVHYTNTEKSWLFCS
jgi:hypothetical protein